MRVCVIGDASRPLDEGMKKTTHALASALAKQCDVLVLNPFDAPKARFWSSLRKYNPDVIHYVPGPSLRSFVLLSLAKRWTSATTVMSLTHPDPALPRRFACRFFGPDLILSQSTRSDEMFQGLGCDVRYMPNGVDIDRFQPPTPAERLRLRQKYGLAPDAYVVLHVGNTRRVRNLDILNELQRDGCQVIVVGSTTIQGDTSVNDSLTAAGCMVWGHYIESIEEVYAVADCYVFPTPTGVGAIEHPLSVLEAMGCNLPVVTKKFGALPRVFQPGDGLFFVDTDAELRALVNRIRGGGTPIRTRAKVAELDWDSLAVRLVDMYQDVKR
jgi:glycosyltransferase involved in cell wall biosynthesis